MDCLTFVLQVCTESMRFEKLMEHFKNEDDNIDFLVNLQDNSDLRIELFSLLLVTKCVCVCVCACVHVCMHVCVCVIRWPVCSLSTSWSTLWRT